VVPQALLRREQDWAFRMRAWNIGQVRSSPDIGWDAFGDMLSPGAQVQVLLHPFIRGKVCPAQVDRAVSCTGGGIAKDDRIIAKWRLSVVDVALAVTPPLPLARDPVAAQEAKLGKTAILLVKSIGVAVRIRLSLWHGDTRIT
jgi:hypothetical protein